MKTLMLITLLALGLTFPCISSADINLKLYSSSCTNNPLHTATLNGDWEDSTHSCGQLGTYTFSNSSCTSPG